MHIKTTITLPLFIATLLLTSACSSTAPRTQFASPVLPNTLFAAKVFVGKCLIAAPTRGRVIPGAGVVASIVSLGVKASVDSFAAAIRRAGEASTTSISASGNFESASSKLPSCVQIIQGRFYTREREFTEDSNPLATSDFPRIHKKMKEIGAYLAAVPHLFFEGQIRRSTDTSAIAIGPSYLAYNEFLGSSSGSKARDLVFSFAISPPASSQNDNRGTVGQLQFSNLPIGTQAVFDSIRPDRVATPETPWIPLSASEQPTPQTMTITVSETRDANKFLLFVADSLTGSKEQIEAVLQQTLVESEKIKVREQEAEAQHKRQSTETARVVEAVEAETAARVAVSKLKTLPDDAPASDKLEATGAARGEQLKANLAARNAGLPEPFAPGELIDLE
ncbi:MAG: hypothetical protein ACR2RB_17160 [Gammaproteobacteria bacterium]